MALLWHFSGRREHHWGLSTKKALCYYFKVRLIVKHQFVAPNKESGSWAGKESACNAGHHGSIPGWGISPWEGIGYPIQYSQASLVAQMVKNPPAMWETWLWSQNWENSLEKGVATHSLILAWRIPCTEEPGRLQSMGSQRVGHELVTFTFIKSLGRCKSKDICFPRPWVDVYLHVPATGKWMGFRKCHPVLSSKEMIALGWIQLQVEMFSDSDWSVCFLSSTHSSNQ